MDPLSYYAVVILLPPPPNLLCRGPFKNVCNSQENGVRTRCAAIVNHPAVLKRLRVVNLLRVVFLVWRGPLGHAFFIRRKETGGGGKGTAKKSRQLSTNVTGDLQQFVTDFLPSPLILLSLLDFAHSSRSCKPLVATHMQTALG